MIGRCFLAEALLETGDLAGAIAEARRGLEIDADSEWASLRHYVLADVLESQGRGRRRAARSSAVAPSRRATGAAARAADTASPDAARRYGSPSTT